MAGNSCTARLPGRTIPTAFASHDLSVPLLHGFLPDGFVRSRD